MSNNMLWFMDECNERTDAQLFDDIRADEAFWDECEKQIGNIPGAEVEQHIEHMGRIQMRILYRKRLLMDRARHPMLTAKSVWVQP